ncbi:MAG: hypothetical protein KDD44_10555, partial [Bdellovibrionales bacterium]|nr:hypothetical protein [Bdellovibrionales bacterium]
MLDALTIYRRSTNGISAERIDPVLRFILSSTPLPETQNVYVALQLVVLVLGATIALRIVGGRWFESFAFGVAIGTSSLFLLGADPFLLKFHYLPLFFAAQLSFVRRASLLRAAVFAAVAALWVTAAGALAPAGVLLSSLAAYARLLVDERGVPSAADAVPSRGKLGGGQFLAAATALAFLAAVWWVPRSSLPGYPDEARFGPGPVWSDGGAVSLGTLVRPNPAIPQRVAALSEEDAPRVAIVAALLLVLIGLQAVRQPYRSWAALVPCAGALLLVQWFHPEVTDWSPFMGLRRVVPGLGYYVQPVALVPPLLFFSFAMLVPYRPQ